MPYSTDPDYLSILNGIYDCALAWATDEGSEDAELQGVGEASEPSEAWERVIGLARLAPRMLLALQNLTTAVCRDPRGRPVRAALGRAKAVIAEAEEFAD